MAHTLEQKRENSKRKRDERRAFAKDKLGGACANCGEIDNLDFDHIDPSTKKMNISHMWTSNIEKFLIELEKCQLLCKECHKEKTFQQNYSDREHGTMRMYQGGKCKCDDCREACRIYMSKYN